MCHKCREEQAQRHRHPKLLPKAPEMALRATLSLGLTDPWLTWLAMWDRIGLYACLGWPGRSA